MKKDTTILLVDDHQIVIDGLSAFLSPHFSIIGQAINGKEAIQAARVLQPDVLLMDIDMPVMNGIVAATEIRKTMPAIKIIILSLHFEKSIIRHLLQLGVMGYLIKSSDKEEVIHAIRMVSANKPYFSGEVTLALNGPNQKAAPSADLKTSELLSQLTEREVEILKAVGEGHSSKEIGAQLHISDRTVDTHRNNIMKKLGVNKVVGLIKFAIRCGLVD